uniref:FLYWCH-type domain-containing protein n=2 Tax=Lygus hesperus TaxID=30085 RepID=A0A146MAE5_LYGHE
MAESTWAGCAVDLRNMFEEPFGLSPYILESQKGMPKLFFGGFLYTEKVRSPNSVRWICSRRSSKRCKGAISSDLNMVTGFRNFVPHSHLPEERYNHIMLARRSKYSYLTRHLDRTLPWKTSGNATNANRCWEIPFEGIVS